MPPKGRTPSPKKKKVDKEEEERLAREEEEARLQAEREEAERKERERREKEERRRLENEEKKRRRAQLEALTDIMNKNADKLFTLHDQRRKDAKWERYMRCDGSPDPTIPGEINTYLNLWREDKQRVKTDHVLDDSKLALALIDELEFLLGDTPKEELDENKRNQFLSTIGDLQKIVHDKLMTAAYYVLVDATDLQDAETANLQSTFSNEFLQLNVWGNLSKNPRIKSFEFARITFDIPRLLRMMDCALIVCFTKFDHFSHRCWTHTTHLKRKEEEPEEQTPAPEDEEEKDKEAEEAEGEEGIEREETEDVMAALRNLDDDADENEEKEEEIVPEEPEEIVPEDLVKTPELPDFEDFEGEEEVVDLRANNTIGGVFHFKLVHLPPQPKVANSLIMVQLEDPPVMETMEYISDVLNKDAETPQDDGKESRQEKEEKKKEEKPPITLSLKLPEDVMVVDEPVVARWIEDENVWRTDGFSDTNYNEENRCITFTTPYFGTFALIQDSHINMPYQSWEIRPRGLDNILYHITAAISEVTIEIKGELCCLQVGEAPELAHLKDQWMRPPALIKAMKSVGINLFPEPDSRKYVSVQEKNAIAEERLYSQMALTASSMAYTWSRWNANCEDAQTIVVQAAESLQDEPIREEDWALFMVTRKRITKLKMSEFDEAFSDDFQEGTNFHADMYHMVMDTVSEQAQERINNSSATFIDCVKQLLDATKPVTYS